MRNPQLNREEKKISLQKWLGKLVYACVIPMILVTCLLLGELLTYTQHYQSLMHNVTMASEFNQSFKTNVDLVMYYYVVGSKYSTGLPIEEVQSAQALAKELIETTTDKNSRKAIESVLSLSESLEEKIYLIAETESYDERQTQLEYNIYILTDLIQEYMYTYLYYEATQLNSLQAELLVQIQRQLVILALVVAVLLLVLSLHVRRMTQTLSKPIDVLCSRVKAIGEGDLTPRPAASSEVTEVQVLSEGFERMVEQLNDLVHQNRQEQISLRKAELALLQAQINPHFLYNTLDTIVWLIETEQSGLAEEMVTNLSAFFRSSLSSGRDVITLGEEENHVRSYMEIQQVRYRDILTYSVQIDSALRSCRIPKLTLQPLVENSLYHGIKLKRGQGFISVTGRAEGADILLTVRDTGVGMTPEKLRQVRASLEGTDRTGFGLVTVHERIQLLFGRPYGLEVDSDFSGTTVTVRIPQSQTVSDPLEQQEAEA
ncbi:MAG: histidine kinase [Candidatus Onthomonas sp.]